MPPHNPDFLPLERELGDRYQIIRVLGSGAFGTVYLARERDLHRVVAIKVLHPDRASNPEERERLRREARTIAQLSHPAIIPLLSFAETPGAVFMVMPYVEGTSLAARLRETDRLEHAEVRRILAEVADALAYTHAQGVLHRDLKPENVLLEQAGAADDDKPPRVRLIDFGVAAFPTRDPGVRASTETWGTPHFMAPEQAFGEPELDPRSEIYSLGILGYLLLGGQLPFSATSSTARLVQQQAGPEVPLSSMAPDAPPDLVAAIERCLAFEPERRWVRARDLRDALLTGSAAPSSQPASRSLVRLPSFARRGPRARRVEAPAVRIANLHHERLMDGISRDFRFTLRSLRRSPGFFAVTVLTLALGIGATTAIFSVVNGVLLRGLPYPNPDRIVRVYQVGEGGQKGQISDPNFEDWKARSRSFSALAQMSSGGTVSVTGAQEPVRARAAAVSAEFFDALGVRPTIGREFAAEEKRVGGAPAVLVSHAFWRRYLEGDRSAVGRTVLTFDRQAYTVVGVLPATVEYPAGVDLWIPRELIERNPHRTGHNWQAIGRLRDGVTLEQAQAEMSAISRGLKQELGDQTAMSDAALVPLQEQIAGHMRKPLLVLLGASAVLLLIACANVVNLLLARMAARQGEFALRLALGAGRGRLTRQVLTESIVLSLAAGVLGIVLAAIGIRVLLALEPGNLPRLSEIELNLPVLAFAIGVALLTAIAMGLLTALRGTRLALREMMAQSQRTQTGSGSSHHIRNSLVVAQVALTLVLLIGAGLLGRSFVRLLDVDPGFRTRGAIVLDVSMPSDGSEESATRRIRFYDDLTTRLSSLPGVSAVGGVNTLPLGGERSSNGTFIIMNSPDEQLRMEDYIELGRDPARTGQAEYRIASPGYFEAMGIPLIRGRLLDARDSRDAPHAAVISASLAETRWPDEDPIGKAIQFGNMDGDLRPFTIVGIVGDVRESSLESRPRPTLYGSYRQRPRPASDFNFIIAGTTTPEAVTAAARQAVRELAPDVPPRFRTVEEVFSRSVADRRFMLLLLSVFGGVALLLAALGVYSVISYLVTQRRQELAIRVALGAQRIDVLGLVLRQGAVLVAIGIVAGSAAALAMTRLISGMLFEVGATDPIAYLLVIVLLGLVAIAATWIPARRASRVEPMNVLRG